ncbi:MAG: serine--tRNA ligase [Clostridia bacterium]|nr:serine--tRNA ligase [Clostridia bacterium]
MLDIKRIIDNTAEVEKALKKRGEYSLTKIVELDKTRRNIIAKVESKKAERNIVTQEIARLKREKIDASSLIGEMGLLADEIKNLDAELGQIEDELNTALASLPNIPDDDLLAGGKENNEVLEYFGEKPTFDFDFQNHYDLCVKNGMIDYERGVKLGGNGYWLYRGVGAELEWALLNYFVSEHLKDGYEFILPPHMLNYRCGYGAGQFPKFADEVYWIKADEGENTQFMLPTAETALVNIFSNEILSEKQLPTKLFAYTPCYRKEAGSYRSEERGMIRGHQFNKVEMVQIAHPDHSAESFAELLRKARSLVEGLGLHYRLSKLAAGDVSASMARTYDIEVWLPSMGIYKEVSSVSNSNDYQARRNNTRFRDEETGKTRFVHTLNGSGLATSRIIPAIVEQYQNADGSIRIPEILQKYLGKTVIKVK